eukprot:CAMPEP_0119318240 /NCGR_PEP_ID=MMETSP1333-20130426/45856_1 /TAXON_ID=418940 /ORGANISM="Scyphosphaera apsteinii, Strain RCC1455" /LENGTH=228 /DNA_ID=CAMNT_0007324377 /DNA_START=115 /DNA_END=798 /DNA_ORIENTATION=+
MGRTRNVRTRRVCWLSLPEEILTHIIGLPLFSEVDRKEHSLPPIPHFRAWQLTRVQQVGKTFRHIVNKVVARQVHDWREYSTVRLGESVSDFSVWLRNESLLLQPPPRATRGRPLPPTLANLDCTHQRAAEVCTSMAWSLSQNFPEAGILVSMFIQEAKNHVPSEKHSTLDKMIRRYASRRLEQKEIPLELISVCGRESLRKTLFAFAPTKSAIEWCQKLKVKIAIAW